MRATHTQQKVTTLNFRVGTIMSLNEKLPPKQTDTNFNFDLGRMKKAVDAKSYAMPDTISNFDEFTAWINQLQK